MVVIYDIQSSTRDYTKSHDAQFLPLAEYIKISRKCIAKLSPPSIAKRMLRDEDAVSFVTEKLMEATNNWEESRGVPLYTYYAKCARWAILTWQDRIIHNKPLMSLNRATYDDSDTQLHETIEGRILTDNIPNIDNISHLDKLTSRQRDCLSMRYLDNMSFKTIAETTGVSRQAVQDTLSRAIQKLKKYNGVKSYE